MASSRLPTQFAMGRTFQCQGAPSPLFGLDEAVGIRIWQFLATVIHACGSCCRHLVCTFSGRVLGTSSSGMITHVDDESLGMGLPPRRDHIWIGRLSPPTVSEVPGVGLESISRKKVRTVIRAHSWLKTGAQISLAKRATHLESASHKGSCREVPGADGRLGDPHLRSVQYRFKRHLILFLATTWVHLV